MKTDRQAPDTNSKRPRRRRWQWVLWPLAILFLPTFSVLTYKEYRYRREIALMRAEGLPTSLEELEVWRGKLKPEEDATDLWLAAAKECERVTKKLQQDFRPEPNDDDSRPPGYWLPFVGNGSLPSMGEPWPDLEKAEDYLSHFQECLVLTRQAIAKGRMRLPIDLGVPMSDTPYQFIRLRRVLMLSVLADLRRNRLDSILPIWRAFLYLGEDIRNGRSFLHNKLTELMMRTSVTELATWAISQRKILGDDLRSMINELDLIDTAKESWHSMCVERVNIIEHRPSYCLFMGNDMYEVPGWILKDEFMREYRQAALDCAYNYPECIDRCEQSIADHSFGIMNTLRRFGFIYPSFDYASPQARSECSIRQTMLAIAFRLYWDEFGKLPTKLSELHPYVAARATVDPFTGKEFRYGRKDVNRAVINGAGADRLFRDEEDGKDGADLTIEIVLPEN